MSTRRFPRSSIPYKVTHTLQVHTIVMGPDISEPDWDLLEEHARTMLEQSVRIFEDEGFKVKNIDRGEVERA